MSIPCCEIAALVLEEVNNSSNRFAANEAAYTFFQYLCSEIDTGASKGFCKSASFEIDRTQGLLKMELEIQGLFRVEKE